LVNLFGFPTEQLKAPTAFLPNGNVEKSRQRRSRPFALLTHRVYAPRVKRAAALLNGLF